MTNPDRDSFLSTVVHPGDVRIVQAVDRPSLRHLRNVIVFNVRGERDLPNMYVRYISSVSLALADLIRDHLWL